MRNLLQAKVLCIAFFALMFMSFELPTGWLRAGSHPDSYYMGIDKDVKYDGASSATIQSIGNPDKGFGTLMQHAKADMFLGKRLQLSGYVKTEDVKGWSGMWLRIDGADSKKVLAFDNMYNRKLKETNDWVYCEIVLDVPQKARKIAYGALLHGSGKIWFDKVQFKVVGKDTETTNQQNKSSLLEQPMNSNLED